MSLHVRVCVDIRLLWVCRCLTSKSPRSKSQMWRFRTSRCQMCQHLKLPRCPRCRTWSFQRRELETLTKQLSTAVPQPTIHCHRYIQNLIVRVKFAQNITKMYPKIIPNFQIINSGGQTPIQKYHRNDSTSSSRFFLCFFIKTCFAHPRF